jgi:RNA polymerase sigma-70 factor (ECF subfamily)
MGTPDHDDGTARAARAALTSALVQTGTEDRAAFRTLYQLTSAKLFGICLRICGERQAAEDVLHDVYITVWRRAAGFDPGRGHPFAWLAAIARNRSIDWRRANAGRVPVPLDEVPLRDPAILAEQGMIDAETIHRLGACLDGLEERQRHAIRAAFFGGIVYAELAAQLSTPLGTVKSWIRRGLARLRDCLDADA